jgi:general secretion pathway protein E
MAQRLVRRLDDATKQPFQPDGPMLQFLQEVIETLPQDIPKPDLGQVTLYKPGSSAENPFGFAGQIPIREQLQMTPGVQAILKLDQHHITTEMIHEEAMKDGMLTMLQDGVLKVLAGETTLEEVYRVVG